MSGISFVIPVFNGARTVERAIDAILAQEIAGPFEIIAVEDGSRDASPQILERYAARGALRVIPGPRRGAAAAVNAGVRAARHPVICQVDQDVEPRAGWTARLVEALDDPAVAAAQGWYETDPRGTIWAKAAGLDLEMRYHALGGRGPVDHVCTGNTAYRKDALLEVGLFDEGYGYGYDNDMSYRLVAAGRTLVIVPAARALHRWRETMLGYLRQQYGVGYGRLDLVTRHRGHLRGDDAAGTRMVLHAAGMFFAISLMTASGILFLWGGPSKFLLSAALVTLAALAADRIVAGAQASFRFRSPIGLVFLPAHLLRDAVWVLAIVVWAARRITRAAARPGHSMPGGPR